MLTAGKLAAKYGVSRTALLYYEKLGLIQPSVRGENGYRLYGEEDDSRLRQVLLYRSIGVPLEAMWGLLSGEDDAVHAILLRRLFELGEELVTIKSRQLAVIGMIANNLDRGKALTDDAISQILKSAGIEAEQARALHGNLERNSPEAHVRFLEALGFQAEEICEIRARYAGEK
jgi:DNA-binding transcriptional MerR regulator